MLGYLPGNVRELQNVVERALILSVLRVERARIGADVPGREWPALC
jgi:DNA-binding NtrC family response regulator